MQWIPGLLLLAAITSFWAKPLPAQAAVSPCDRISRKGELHINNLAKAEATGVYNCEGIRSLSFRKSDIIHLPKWIVNLTKLESLNLSKTGLERFPMAITQLKNLRNLDLSFTKLYYLPPEIKHLINLETLNLRGTKISNLPPGLEHLHTIDMRMIDLSRDEQETLRKAHPEIEIYFSSPCNCD